MIWIFISNHEYGVSFKRRRKTCRPKNRQQLQWKQTEKIHALMPSSELRAYTFTYATTKILLVAVCLFGACLSTLIGGRCVRVCLRYFSGSSFHLISSCEKWLRWIFCLWDTGTLQIFLIMRNSRRMVSFFVYISSCCNFSIFRFHRYYLLIL